MLRWRIIYSVYLHLLSSIRQPTLGCYITLHVLCSMFLTCFITCFVHRSYCFYFFDNKKYRNNSPKWVVKAIRSFLESALLIGQSNPIRRATYWAFDPRPDFIAQGISNLNHVLHYTDTNKMCSQNKKYPRISNKVSRMLKHHNN